MNRQRDSETERRRDRETGRGREREKISPSLCLSFSPSSWGGISMKATAFILLLTCLLLLSSSAQSQRLAQRPDFRSRRDSGNSHRKLEYTFARLEYESYGWRDMWTTDYPKADQQFIMGLR